MSDNNFNYLVKLLYCFRKKLCLLEHPYRSYCVIHFKISKKLDINYNFLFIPTKTIDQFLLCLSNEWVYMLERSNRKFKSFLKEILNYENPQ